MRRRRLTAEQKQAAAERLAAARAKKGEPNTPNMIKRL